MLCGWLSPNGDFYPCGPYEHVHLADKLTSSHYPNTEDTVKKYLDQPEIQDLLKTKGTPFPLFSEGWRVAPGCLAL